MSNAPRLVVLLFLIAVPAPADVELPAILGSNMVLQQGRPARFWGKAEIGENVVVSASWGAEARCTTGEDGRWAVSIDVPPAGGPYSITVKGRNTIRLDDVLVGEVWVCSGQSNMEWRLDAVGRPDEVAAASDPLIRMFDVERRVAIVPVDDCEGRWEACTPDVAKAFSAVGYYFGRKLRQELGVPIGLVGSNWGGTPAESWTSETSLRPLKDFDERLDELVAARAKGEDGETDFREALAAWRRNARAQDAGIMDWTRPELDDSEWETMDLPRLWRGTDIESLDGVVWYRRDFELTPDLAAADCVLELGPIDDQDITWINGKRVGAMQGFNDWNRPRVYRIKSGVLKPGRNSIVIRVLDTGGAGGLNGKPEQMRLRERNGERSVPLAGAWRYQVGLNLEGMKPIPRTRRWNAHTPSGLYNGMIAPITNLVIRGAIWYQGESNRNRAAQYKTLFPAMIADWRRAWGLGDFPFYFVQIAPFGYRGGRNAAEVREAQMETLRRSNNTGMVVTMDVGDPRDIHPRNKLAVGRRLALWALAKTYGRGDIVFSGPLYRSYDIEGNRIRLRFDHVDSGLKSLDGKPLRSFTIAARGGEFVPAKAVIDGETVVVWSDAIPRPEAVRFAWANAPAPNLANGNGLPASSFRTDSRDL